MSVQFEAVMNVAEVYGKVKITAEVDGLGSGYINI